MTDEATNQTVVKAHIILSVCNLQSNGEAKAVDGSITLQGEIDKIKQTLNISKECFMIDVGIPNKCILDEVERLIDEMRTIANDPVKWKELEDEASIRNI